MSLLEDQLRRKSNLVSWPDILNNTITEHPYRHAPAAPVPELLETLRQHKDKFAVAYVRREGHLTFSKNCSLGTTSSSTRGRNYSKKASKGTRSICVPQRDPSRLIICNSNNLRHLIQQARLNSKAFQKERAKRMTMLLGCGADSGGQEDSEGPSSSEASCRSVTPEESGGHSSTEASGDHGHPINFPRPWLILLLKNMT